MTTESQLRATLALYHDGSSAILAGSVTEQQQRAERVFGSTTALLANLTNPLNISLLTSHFLAAPAIWQHQDPLADIAAAQFCFRVISVYNTAAIHVRRHELEDAAAVRHGLIHRLYQYGANASEKRPTSEAWARAVAQGADARSPRWRHLLVLGGVLLGLESGDRQSLSPGRRAALEQGVVAAANLALEEWLAEAAAPGDSTQNGLARFAVALTLTYVFPLLSAHARAGLHSDLLLPAMVAELAGPRGFQGGRILSDIEADLRQGLQGTSVSSPLHWPSSSASFARLLQLEDGRQQALVSSAGPLATLASYAAERATPGAVLAALDGLLGLTEQLWQQWMGDGTGRLAAIDLGGNDADEAAQLTPETAQTTWPVLWRHLRRIFYAVVVVLKAIIGRSLRDRSLAGNNAVAPRLAANVLRTLRNLSFISSRQGADAFQAYQFTLLASIDLLARYPDAAAHLLDQLLPTPPLNGTLTAATIHPQRLTADLFYLNLAEHFAAVLPAAACDRLLIQPALPYVSPTATDTPGQPAPLFSPRAVYVFEAAHSATLSALSCPHNAPLAATLSPFYAEALFASFPDRISARQFRLAFKTLIQILSPPFPVYATHPDLAETLLEMVRLRATQGSASTVPLAGAPGETASQGVQGPVSEQSALVLTLIDALPFLALSVLEDWMTMTAQTIWAIGGDPALRQTAQRRFWEVLGSGEMDVERAAMGVFWWGNRGGSELVLQGGRRPKGPEEVPVMSGALPDGRIGTKL